MNMTNTRRNINQILVIMLLVCFLTSVFGCKLDEKITSVGETETVNSEYEEQKTSSIEFINPGNNATQSERSNTDSEEKEIECEDNSKAEEESLIAQEASDTESVKEGDSAPVETSGTTDSEGSREEESNANKDETGIVESSSNEEESSTLPETSIIESQEEPVNDRDVLPGDSHEDSKVNESIHIHSYTVIETISATCTTDGFKIYGCECGDTYQEEGDVKLGHMLVHIKGTEATCSQGGMTDGQQCSRCDYIEQPQTVIPPLGHSWSDWYEVKKPEVDEVGEEERTCSLCQEKEAREIDALSVPEFDSDLGVFYYENTEEAAYIYGYMIGAESHNMIIEAFSNHFGYSPIAEVRKEFVGTFLVDGNSESIYRYSISDSTYPLLTEPLYQVYSQMCTDGKSHWVGFAIRGAYEDDWGTLFGTAQVQALRQEMLNRFYEETGYTNEYISQHPEDFLIEAVSVAGFMRTYEGELVSVLFKYCRER